MAVITLFRRMVEPSGKPTLTRISFSWTLASQVILKVGMFSLLCSQNLISASSPPTLKNKIFTLQIPQEIKLIKVKKQNTMQRVFKFSAMPSKPTELHPRPGRRRARPRDRRNVCLQSFYEQSRGVFLH